MKKNELFVSKVLVNIATMKIICLFIIIFTPRILFSQPISHISFTYDNAGNRKTRQVIYLKATEVEDTLVTNQNTFGLVTDAVKYKGTPGSQEIMKPFAL